MATTAVIYLFALLMSSSLSFYAPVLIGSGMLPWNESQNNTLDLNFIS